MVRSTWKEDERPALGTIRHWSWNFDCNEYWGGKKMKLTGVMVSKKSLG